MLTTEQQALCHHLIDISSSEIIEILKAFIGDKTVSDAINGDYDKKSGKRQFNDFMEAANRTSSIAELELYIAYKGTKKGSAKTWANLAMPAINQIKPGGTLQKVTNQIVDYAKRHHKQDLLISDVHIEVVRRFAGYLMWQAHIMIGQPGIPKKKEQQNMHRRARNVP